MSIENLKNQLPEYAKDIRLNVSSVLTEEGAGDLTQKQIYIIAMAVAHATRNRELMADITEDAMHILSDVDMNAAKAAAIMMAMNNVYYRFVHLSSDKSYANMPARLRMNIIANPGIDKMDFELACLAVSAVNGCGMCIDAHASVLTKGGASRLAIQSAVRIAAVLNAFAMGVTG